MSQNVPPRVGGGCSVWECEGAVIAASLRGKHRNLADNTAFQDGTVPSSPEISRGPVNGVKHTAKRTKRFFIRRSGTGSTPVRSEAARVPADSGNPIPFGLANANANATPRKESKGLPDNHVGTYPTQASSRPPIPTQAKSCAVNTIIHKSSHEAGISTSSTAQPSVPHSSLNIICATVDDSITGHHSKPLDIVDNSHASATIDHGGPNLAHDINGKPPMPPVDLENIQSSKPREPVHSASTSLNEPRSSVQVEHAKVRSGATAKTSLKRKLDSVEHQESRPEFDFPKGQKEPAPFDDVYRHSTGKAGVAILNSAGEQKLNPIGHKEIESPADSSTPFSIEAGSQKGLRAAKRRIVRRKTSILLAESKASTQAKRASEPNLKAKRGTSITSTLTMETMDPKESHSGPVSENHVYTEAAFSADCCPEETSRKFSNSQQDQPGLAIKQPTGKQSFLSRSTDHSIAPSPKTDISMMNRVRAPPRVTAEERRLARILNFDPAAFDAMIYRQAETRTPQGIASINSRQKTPTPSNEDQRLYLHTNPAIHRLHNRSEEWHQVKALEIKARGGRKAWFGKAAQRERWLRAKERADEEKQKAMASGSRPKRPEPQPWTYSRAMDFGDVPPEKLPEDVLRNPAWAKACAWHRENQVKRVFRQRAAKNRHQQAWDHLKNAMKVVESGSKKKRGEAL